MSSREQEQEGFSLAVQEEGFGRWEKLHNAVVDPLFVVAETASKAEERKKFKEMLAFARRHADEYYAFVCYKFDRAARNLTDYNALETLERERNLLFLSITQAIENTPTGRMLRLYLAGIARFQTEQQSLDVREGIARRVAEGWFPSTPPFGYKNRRIDKRSIVETHPQNANKVRRIADLRVNHGLTATEIMDQMFDEGLFYSDSKPKFSESKINSILHDRSYLGFIRFRGAWHPGRHEVLVDQVTWDKIRVSFNEQNYRSHDLVYASRLIRCGHCGHVVTGEEKFKQTKAGMKSYVYYRCSKYGSAGHPRIRMTEAELDQQIVEALKPLGRVCSGTREVIEALSRSFLNVTLSEGDLQVSECRRLLSLLDTQRAKLLKKNLADAIPDELYDRQMTDFADQESKLRKSLVRYEETQTKIDTLVERSSKVFSMISTDWLQMERRARQLALSSLFGGFRLEGKTLIPENRTRLELFRAS
ncbi:recombinase family protein [Roseiconus lacunae]|uniref:recombinase family protein n=1 Tax=Roseiconus lacunae TaxID=2605694 RepID=UPI001E3E2E7D|nr:recombinase family protein [Roseiconus lacunae]MCD0459531.1 recombinase family protein [Roseiconus lacunae]